MFETSRPLPLRPTRTWLTLSASAIAHSVAIVAIIGISVYAAKHEEPAPEHIQAFVLPPGVSAPPPAGRPQPSPIAQQAAPKPEPVVTTAPPTTTSAEPPPSAASVQVSGASTGLPAGIAGGTDITGSLAAPPSIVRIGGGIDAPALMKKVAPVYPPLAKAAHLQGNVVLEARVSKDGIVESVDVIKSMGQLDAAAVNAVKQWRYKPLLLNGQPTPFILSVTVSFSLTGMD